jgi:hypothetical protein
VRRWLEIGALSDEVDVFCTAKARHCRMRPRCCYRPSFTDHHYSSRSRRPDAERQGVDLHTYTLLLQRPNRSHVWLYPHSWIAGVVDVCLFLAGTSLIFSAGMRFGQWRSRSQLHAADPPSAIHQR